VVLLGHGTQDAEGVAEFLGYVEGIRRRWGGIVTAGVLEYPSDALPDIPTAFAQAIEQGADDLIALPVLLFFAGHARRDVPGEVMRMRERYPDHNIRLAGPIGVQEALIDVVEERLRPFVDRDGTAVLLVGRGALDAEANADLFKIARLLWERRRFPWVEASFISVAQPFLPAGLERCRQLGARRVIVVPYFLNTGVLVKRIATQAHLSGIEVTVTPHLGLHAQVLDLLLQRLQQAQAGICACRSAMPCRMAGLGCACSGAEPI
jgi:sirohydrochlorin cobaltochelatase